LLIAIEARIKKHIGYLSRRVANSDRKIGFDPLDEDVLKGCAHVFRIGCIEGKITPDDRVARDPRYLQGCGQLLMYTYFRNAVPVDFSPELIPPCFR
jgi:hypothetical protein